MFALRNVDVGCMTFCSSLENLFFCNFKWGVCLKLTKEGTFGCKNSASVVLISSFTQNGDNDGVGLRGGPSCIHILICWWRSHTWKFPTIYIESWVSLSFFSISPWSVYHWFHLWERSYMLIFCLYQDMLVSTLHKFWLYGSHLAAQLIS